MVSLKNRLLGWTYPVTETRVCPAFQGSDLADEVVLLKNRLLGVHLPCNETCVCSAFQGSNLADEVVSLKNRLAEAEEEKGNLQLKLVDFEEMRTLIGKLKKSFCDHFRHFICGVLFIGESLLDKHHS